MKLMEDQTRRLAVILCADVAGYARLMHENEESTHARLQHLMNAAINPAVARHGGRIVKTVGDGFLAEFASPVEAVRCAFAVQHAVSTDNGDGAPGDRVEFRVGITLGDVIAEAGDVFGDDVNIAARLQSIAEPGGILVSEAVQERIRGRLPCVLENAGALSLKNIARPVRAWRVLPVGASPVQAVVTSRPSIAVLPFENIGGNPEQEYFADGIVEEIITALSHVRWFFVIARNSSFTYKGRIVDIKQVGRELGVRYVLEGSVRRAGNRMRITAQLIEAESNSHIWAHRYDGGVEDVFDLQDQITESVVTAIEPQIQTAELKRTRCKRADNLTAYDSFLRGMAQFWMSGFESAEGTLALFRRAIDSDPGFAPAYALAAQCYVYRVSQGVSPDVAEEAAEGARMAEAAIDRDPEDPTVLALAGHALGHLTNQYEKALALMERALALNPNSAMAWQLSGWMRVWVGDAADAVQRFRRGQRLSPLDIRGFIIHSGLAAAFIMLEQYEAAIGFARQAISEAPHWHTGYRMLAAALAGAGRLKEARAAAAQHLRLNPGYNLRLVRMIFKPSAGRDILIDCFRKAGLPE